MLRLRVAEASGGDNSYLGMHMLSKFPGAGAAQDRLLYDKDAYLRHLEHQVASVALAKEQVDQVRGENEALLGEVGTLGLQVKDYFSLVREGEARRDALQGRVEALESLGDRLTSLEVQSKQQQSPAMALIERVVAVETAMQRVERARVAQVETLTARLEAAEAANEKLHTQCRDLKASQQDAVERLQHEMGMGLSRALSSSTKQGMLMHEELARLQQQVADLAQRVVAMQQEQQEQQQQQQRQESLLHLEPTGSMMVSYELRQEETRRSEESIPVAATVGGAWEKKLRVLTAAFRHAEESHQRTHEEQQTTLAAMQQSLAVMGGKALETTRQQAEAVLGVVRQLETRLETMEQKMGARAAPIVDEMDERRPEQPREEREVEDELVAFLEVGRWEQQEEQSDVQEEGHEQAPQAAEDSDLQAHMALVEALHAVESLKGELVDNNYDLREGGQHCPSTRSHAAKRSPLNTTMDERGGDTKKRGPRKSLIPHPPSNPPLAAAQKARVRPPPRLTVAAGSEEKARFLSWLSQQSVAQQTTQEGGTEARPGGRKQVSQLQKPKKSRPSLLKKAYHNVMV